MYMYKIDVVCIAVCLTYVKDDPFSTSNQSLLEIVGLGFHPVSGGSFQVGLRV